MVDRFVWLAKIDRDYAIHALREYKKRCCNDDEPWQKLIDAKELDRLIKERMNADNPETTLPGQPPNAEPTQRKALDKHTKREGRS